MAQPAPRATTTAAAVRNDFARARDRMVSAQIGRRGVRDPAVLEAFRAVPRERFVDPGYEEFAYEDSPLPIGSGQTISQPFIVAMMVEAAAVKPGDAVLEVGAGSGYAAAVLSRIAGRVYAIERHASLAEAAQARLHALDYHNVEIRAGDGTKGWPEAAPFDAILVAAGGPDVPESLKQQLKIGGRLIIPVGRAETGQSLLKVTRKTETEFSTEDLGSVRFVPLIGAEGWSEKARKPAPRVLKHRTVPEMIAAAAEPLPAFDDPTFGALFDRFADRRVVLLGEASHGTSEFYQARAAITRWLVEAHGFDIVAVEADWPDAAAVDRYVRHRPPRAGAESPFRRFPTWMWRNTDVEAFTAWMRAHNAGRPPDRQVGFYGLDIYNLSGSVAAVLDYLDRVDPAAAQVARARYGCLTPWQTDPSTYGRAVLSSGYRACEQAVIAQCRELLAHQLDYEAKDGGDFFDAAQNARLVAAAEHYYRAMYYGGSDTWNLRDSAMFDTLERVLAIRGPNSKAVIWAHNSHIGDARHTEMGMAREQHNIGQLCRERFDDHAALIGLGTDSGTVAAADDWDGEMRVKSVRPALPGSYERLCHDSGNPRFLLELGADETLRQRLLQPQLERFIGVIYRPESERFSHYTEAILPRQFDAYLWFDETNAVTPLGKEPARPGLPETYPFGL